ncbi:methionyl-tRNA formyltransferase [Patescibacteria group bacterium]|nr:methionyl-tRNA formyltransferase [Patescibacteria group bacterium]
MIIPVPISKIVFMGTSDFAVAMLQTLWENKFNIIAVFTKADSRAGRGYNLQKSAVKKFAQEKNLFLFQPEKLDEKSTRDLKSLQPDLIIVADYGKIIPPAVLKLPPRGVINIHPSLLPKFRGSSPIQNVLLFGETKTGTTIMLLDEGMDTGDILAQERMKIQSGETFSELSLRLAQLSSQLLLKTIPLWLAGKIEPQKQDEAQASQCRMIKKEDGKINWTQKADEIFNRYRAFENWPGIYTFWLNQGKIKRINLKKIALDKPQNDKKIKTGEVFWEEEKLKVQTGTGVLILEKLQMENKVATDYRSFINGYKNFVGSILK